MKVLVLEFNVFILLWFRLAETVVDERAWNGVPAGSTKAGPASVIMVASYANAAKCVMLNRALPRGGLRFRAQNTLRVRAARHDHPLGDGNLKEPFYTNYDSAFPFTKARVLGP